MLCRSIIFRRLCVYMVLAIFLTTSVFGQVNQADTAKDYFRGREEAKNAVRVSSVWFFAGFGLGPGGVLLAYLIKPSPSPAMLAGKSQTYIKSFTDTYKQRSTSEQCKLALTGMVIAFGLYIIISMIMIIFLVKATTMYD